MSYSIRLVSEPIRIQAAAIRFVSVVEETVLEPQSCCSFAFFR